MCTTPNSRCRVVSTIEDGLIAPKLPIGDVAILTVGVGTIILEVEKFCASSLYSHIAISEVCCARYFMFKSPTIPDVDPHPICNSQVLICPHPARGICTKLKPQAENSYPFFCLYLPTCWTNTTLFEICDSLYDPR